MPIPFQTAGGGGKVVGRNEGGGWGGGGGAGAGGDRWRSGGTAPLRGPFAGLLPQDVSGLVVV